MPSGGRLQGVLELFRNEPLAEREEEEALASALGHQLGRFLERLRNERTEHTRDTALLTPWNADLLGLFVSDAQGRLLDANPTLPRMLGYTRQDLGEGRLTWARLPPAAWRATSEGALRRLREDGTYHSFEGELLRKNESGLPVLLGSGR
ncbi:MAG TPA: PAS domain-containing protein [Archangium sp.]|uniref:PAS domain-containing protein n=1 Tax=Archangium sp. TaxID=1872627 RepID=UPI002ED846C6